MDCLVTVGMKRDETRRSDVTPSEPSEAAWRHSGLATWCRRRDEMNAWQYNCTEMTAYTAC